MKKLFFLLLICTVLIIPNQKAHAMSPKTKAFLVICTYGTVGGALLGFASMAFGTNSRAIAQGASLGLYAGIAFGAYVINSHGQSNAPIQEDYPPPAQQPPPPGFNQGGFGQPASPFGGDQGYGNPEGGFGAPPPEDDGGFFGSPQRGLEIHDDLFYNYRLENKKGRSISLPLYINLYNATF